MKTWILSILTFLLLTVSTAFNHPDATSYYNSGVTALNSKDYIKAIGDFTNAISLNPKYADAYYYRAYSKELLGIKMGFTSTEMCSDLVMAMYYGKNEAASKLEKSCMLECFPADMAFEEPEIVYCADFSSKVLTDLPAGSGKMTYLVKLNMFNNKLTALSKEWEKLDKLISLDLSSNKLTAISPSIGKLIHLKELNLNKNPITSLPVEIGNLKNLQTLTLRQNGLTQFPGSIAMLTSLENLDLALNKLTSLPMEVANLKNLKTLTLVGNEIPSKEQNKIKALLPKTKIYFE